MSKAVILGWVITLVGSVLWIYGYFVTGSPTLFDWKAHTPWWIADFLPNIQTEIGMILTYGGMVFIYWPTKSD